MADRYWVGGTGTWNTSSTANWSATSGGGSGASVPTAADSVFFNAASAAGNYTVTITGAGLTCLDLNVAQAAAGTFTTAGNGTLIISGNLVANSTGVTWGHIGILTFNATSAKTITTGGLVLPNAIIFNGVGGTWQLQDNYTAGAVAAATTTLTNGTLDLNAKTLTTAAFVSNNANVRALVATGATINVFGNATSPWATAVTNFTVTGRLTVNATYAGATGTRTMAFSAFTEAVAPNLNITAGTDSVQVTGSVNNLSTTGFSGTFNGGLRTIYGSLTFSATTTIQSSASATTLTGTSGTKTITTNGRTIDFPLTINGQGSTWQLQDSYTGGATSTSVVTLSGGTLDLNGQAFTAFRFSGTGAGIRSLVATGSTFTLFGNANTILDFSTIGGLTLTGLATVTFTYAGAVGNRTITSNAGFTEAQAFNLVITGGTDTLILGGGMRDLDLTGFGGNLNAGARILYGNLTLGTSTTVVSGATATGFSNTSGTTTIDTKGRAFPQQMTFAGVGGTRRLLSNVNLDVRNIAFTGGNLDLNDFTMTAFAFNGSVSTARQLQFGNSGVINLTANGTAPWNCATVTGFSYTGNGRVNLTYAGATSTRTISHGSAAGGSDATKAPPLYFVSGATDTIAASANSYWSDLIFADGANVTLTNTTKFIFGNLTFSPGMNIAAGASSILFAGNGVQTFDSANLALDFPIVIGTGFSTGNLQLANTTTLGSTRALTLSSGNLNANGFDITTGVFSSTNSNPRIVDISNITMSITGGGTVWSMATSTNANVIATNSNINLTSTLTTARAFAGGGLTYGNLDIGGATGTSTLLITGTNTFAGALTSSKTVAHTISFAAGITTTVGAFTVTGTAGNVVTITSATAAQHNLVLTGGGNVTTVDYLNISYSNASPDTDTWYPGVNSINSGNNNGWMFPVSGGSSNFFLVF
jgi:hypothetical protein